jgi:signal transduction histidine kinase
MTNIKKIMLALVCILQTNAIMSQYNKKLIALNTKYNNKQYKEVVSECQSLEKQLTTKLDIAYLHRLKADALVSLNKNDLAYNNFLISKAIFKQLDSLEAAMDINIKIVNIFRTQQNNKIDYQLFLNESLNYYNSCSVIRTKVKGYFNVASLKINTLEANESIQLFHKALTLSKNLKNDDQKSFAYNNLAVLYNEIKKIPDSALFYLKKDLPYLIQKKDQDNICYNLINQASSFSKKKNFVKAIQLLHIADSIKILYDVNSVKFSINSYLNQYYKANNDAKNALIHLEKANAYRDSLEVHKQNIAINEVKTKYETKAKEIENGSLKNKLNFNKKIMFSIVLLLVAFIIIAILVYNDFSRKKKIANQERLIQQQIVEKTLKNQELHAIDVMLESQERERHKIANELHDNLGSMLATLKLNFQNLKRQQEHFSSKENNLYDKTDDLIEEAYQEVRNIAHLKNLGVIASEGLLLSVKKMAEKMSVLERLKVNVIPFGLSERLENQIEVTLFRMIQELCTNSIKHAQASEINIYLTQDNATEINLIIEDNGKGFDTKAIRNADGMGLKSMEKKVEQMGGTFTIDSKINNGTTIIIDLPL